MTDYPDLVHRLRRSYQIKNPVAVIKLCEEAADVIDALASGADAMPKRRGRPPKVRTEDG